MRGKLLIMQATHGPSQLTAFPPVLDTPPNPFGCWLPIDSPYFKTAKCPKSPTSTAGMFEIGKRFMVPAVNNTAAYNFYVTADLIL
jgi:hypothetical protein